MESDDGESHDQVVEKLTTGFGAMLEQVQELARRNMSLEQRLTQGDESRHHIATEEDQGVAHKSLVWLRADKDGTAERTSASDRRLSGSQNSDRDAIWYMGATGQDNAMAIVSGVQAWKVLTNGKGPLWRKFNQEQMSNMPSKEAKRRDSQGGDVLSPNHTQEERENPQSVDCPFAAMAHLGEQQRVELKASEVHRPSSLPTPPPNQEHFIERPSYNNAGSPPHSVSASASKCPIRLLDERSPEEVAEYFETHKHEVPRSHAICVKRYQSNEQSIRQLDAKYGNLVNMLQQLGMKHQPLLQTQGETRGVAGMDKESAEKVERWADNVRELPADVQDLHTRLLLDTEDRQGHFERSLREVRVGESPSRPCGIPMLGAGPLKGNGGAESKTDQSTSDAVPPAKKPSGERHDQEQKDGKPSMVFTGPVFIGYGAEQAAALIEKCGWDPKRSNN